MVESTTPPPERLNFAAHLAAVNAGREDKIAYVDDRGATTYRELFARVRSFAGALMALGVRPEERIFLVMLDTVDLPVAFLGALHAGVVPVVVNTLLPPSDYAFMVAHCRARLVVASSALLGRVLPALDSRADSPALVVSMSPDETRDLPPHAEIFERLLLSATPIDSAFDAHAEDIAFWLYSSGSTGKPKGTVHTHGNLYWTAELYAKPVLGMRETDVVFSAAKLFFAYGLGNALTFPLSVGATTILMAERPTSDAVFRRLVEHKPTIFCGVPTLYLSMMSSPSLPSREDVALRLCVSAGESLPERIGNLFTDHFGAEILDGIGSTEMLHIYLSNRPGDVRYGTTGLPVPGYEIELRAEDGTPVSDGEIGDLYVSGPSAALLYWQSRERSRATFQGKWLKTGDKFSRLPSGHYVYGGRSDDMLKVSGQYVSPVEVESALQEHPAVAEAAVVGATGEDGLVRTRAFVVVRSGHDASEELGRTLKEFVKQRLAPHKYPRDVRFVDELPKTATGKIQRFVLRART